MKSNLYFIYSALTEENPFISTNDAKKWLINKNNITEISINKVRFDKLKNWVFTNGKLQHLSGKFFSIDGINVKTNWGEISEWEQPIINQPEIGYLGIITKEINGILYFLMQAKIEPGNINHVQLSPTLQATKSNYTQIHKGKKPLYLEYFQKANQNQILLDQLQSEQGARFLKKRNRNIIIKTDENIPVFENFIWLTLGQIKKLMMYDNLVNMDTRTVISGISFTDDHTFINMSSGLKKIFFKDDFKTAMLLSAMDISSSVHSIDEIIRWVTSLKSKYELDITKIPIETIDKWIVSSYEIHHIDNKYFKVIGAYVKIGNREVKEWYQPLIEPMQHGLIAFIVKKINGIYHFLIQAKLECGNFDIIEMAPTVQCLTGSYENTENIPFLDYVINAPKNKIIFDTLQSEEGGRFFKEQNRNILVEADEKFPDKIPDNFIWISFYQLSSFLKYNNYLNIQARSLISAINFI